MKKKPDSSKVAVNLHLVDLDKICRVGDKVRILIRRKIKNPIEAYLVLKLLCMSFEDVVGFSLDFEEESKLRKMFVEEIGF